LVFDPVHIEEDAVGSVREGIIAQERAILIAVIGAILRINDPDFL
jgi:hypothetical protein